MDTVKLKLRLGLPTALLGLLMSGGLFAQGAPSECVVQGALAFDNWTKTDAGGSGLPTGVTDADYVRCKACHGWDRLGTDGGYVRRTRTASRPNAGAGDGDATSRAIVAGEATSALIAHAGAGRSYDDGRGSWVALDAVPSAENKAEHARGYTLGNQHPDFSGGGVNGSTKLPTQEQVDCLVEFLNYADGDASAYFDAIYPEQNPVLYTIVSTADAAAGEAFYADSCDGCHGAPDEYVLGYLEDDGKFSELAHKARWGIPNTEMTRENVGDPTSQDIANVLLYLQQLGGTGFAMNAGINGNWYGGPARDGEGFQLEVSAQGDGLVLVGTFYSYDPDGNLVWLLGVGSVAGDTAEVVVYFTDGPVWGTGFNPADVDQVEWGSGTFTASSCGAVHVTLQPNGTFQALGFTAAEYDLVRVTTPAMPCPTVVQN